MMQAERNQARFRLLRRSLAYAKLVFLVCCGKEFLANAITYEPEVLSICNNIYKTTEKSDNTAHFAPVLHNLYNLENQQFITSAKFIVIHLKCMYAFFERKCFKIH